MLFPEYQENYTLYRLSTPSGYADRTWENITIITGRVEPIGGMEFFSHDQAHGDINEIMMSPIEYRGIVQPNDMLVDAYSVGRKVIGHPEDWPWEIDEGMAHIAIKLQRVQWSV
jgi:hypothetical protein